MDPNELLASITGKKSPAGNDPYSPSTIFSSVKPGVAPKVAPVSAPVQAAAPAKSGFSAWLSKTFADNTKLGIIKNTVTGLPKATVDLVKGQGEFAPDKVLGIARNTVTGLPSTARDIAKETPNAAATLTGKVYDIAGGIIAPGITHDELRDPKFLWNTAKGLPGGAYDVAKGAITHPIKSAQGLVGGIARGISDATTNMILNTFVGPDMREATRQQVKDTLDKYLTPPESAFTEGSYVAGETAPALFAATSGAGAAQALGAPAVVGEALGFVGVGQASIPREASIEQRTEQALTDLVGLGIFKVGSIAYQKAKTQIKTAITKATDTALNNYDTNPFSKGHGGEPAYTFRQLEKNILSDNSVGATNYDAAIKAGDLQASMVYKDPVAKIFQPDRAQAMVSDIAANMNRYKPGLGNDFAKAVDVNNATAQGIRSKAINILEDAHVAHADSLIVTPPVAKVKPTEVAPEKVLKTDNTVVDNSTIGEKQAIPDKAQTEKIKTLDTSGENQIKAPEKYKNVDEYVKKNLPIESETTLKEQLQKDFTFDNESQFTETVRAKQAFDNYIRQGVPEGDAYTKIQGSYGVGIKAGVQDFNTLIKERLTEAYNTAAVSKYQTGDKLIDPKFTDDIAFHDNFIKDVVSMPKIEARDFAVKNIDEVMRNSGKDGLEQFRAIVDRFGATEARKIVREGLMTDTMTPRNINDLVDRKLNALLDAVSTPEVIRARNMDEANKAIDRIHDAEYDITPREAEAITRQLFTPDEIKMVYGKDVAELSGFTDPQILKNLEGFYRSRGFAADLIGLVEKNGKVSSNTLYHESFHAYLERFVDRGERAKVIDYVINNKMTAPARKILYDDKAYPTKEAKAEEWLADDFARFVKEKTADKQLMSFYQKMLAKIRDWVRKKGELEQLYERILNKDRSVVNPKTRRLNILNFKLGESLPEDLARQKLAIEIKQEVVDAHPAKRFAKYAATRGEFAGQLPEITGGKNAKSFFGKKGDIYQGESGYADSEAMREGYLDYVKQTKQLTQMKRQFQAERVKYYAERKAESIAARDEKALNKMGADTARETTRMEEIANKDNRQASLVRRETLQRETQQIAQAAKEQGFRGRAVEDSLAKGVEMQQKETLLGRSETAKLSKPENKASDSLPDIIQKGNDLSVNDKVGILDYMRTPDRVLKKIGLEKEADLVRKKYDDYLEELPKNIDKITQWSKEAPGKDATVRIFDALDGKEGVKLSPVETRIVGEVRVWLKEWAERLGLPVDGQISHYITHIFEKDFLQKEFDPELAKIIQDKVPGSVYDPFLQKRLGALGYVHDAWRALDAYTKRATRKVHMDVALEQLKEASKTLEISQFNYVKRYADRLNLRPTEWDNLLDNQIKQLVGYRFGQRPVTAITRSVRQWIYRGTLGLNLGSALKNLSQGANTYAKLGEKYTVIGYSKLIRNIGSGELERVGVLRDEFIQDRQISATKKFWEKTDKGLFVFFEAAEKINRGAAYYGAKAKALAEGKTEAQAIEYGKKIVRDTQFSFGAVDTPVAMQSDLAKLITQFQSFTVKQTELLIEMGKNKEFAGLVRYSLASTLIMLTVGRLYNMQWKDLIPSFRFGFPPAVQGPINAIQAAFGDTDKFGNPMKPEDRVSGVLKATASFVPAGVQIKKSIEGYQTATQGVQVTGAGKPKYEVKPTATNKIRGVLFGKSSFSEVQSYNSSVFSGKKDPAVEAMRPTFEKVKALGYGTEEADAIVADLSPEEYAAYKKLKAADSKKKSVETQQVMLDTYNQVAEAGFGTPEADALTEAMTEDEYKAYKLLKKKFEGKTTEEYFKTGEKVQDTSLISSIITYAKALGTDPVTAFDRIFTGQKIRRVDNGTIVVERMTKEESQNVKEQRGGKNATMKLDHTIPLQLGGSNDEDNLKLVPTEVWASYTPVENYLGKELRAGRMTKKEIQDLITRFKAGEISASDIIK